MLLADMGAEVIKIETGDGDISRQVGPNYVGEHNAYFASLNRGKKGITLDIQCPEDRHEFYRLVANADALVSNLRPRAILKLGLTYDDLKHINPKLVCVALTGYGLGGPYSDMPAYDYVIQALCGIAMLTGNPESPPTRVGYSVVDNTGGMMAVIGMLAKLLEGKGGQLDISLYDTMLSQLNYLASAWLNASESPTRQPDGGHAYIVPAQFFETNDGYIALFITHDKFWTLFASEAKQEHWIKDERFATMESRSLNRDLVLESVKAVLQTDSSDSWVARLQPLGVVCAGVRSLTDALEDEHTRFRDMVISVASDQGIIKLVGNPVKIVGDKQQFSPPPLLGEHNQSILGR